MKSYCFTLALSLFSATSALADTPKFIDIIGSSSDVEDVQTIKIALKAGVDPNATDAEGNSASFWAIYKNHPKALVKLLKAGASPNSRNKQGTTLLMNAADNAVKDPKFTQMVVILLKHRADINAEIHGTTALASAVAEVSFAKEQSVSVPPVIEYLLQRGADPNICATPDPKIPGISPLMAAARFGKSALVKVLLKYKARIDLKGPGGKTAIDIAIDNKHADLAKELQRALKP